MSQASWATSKAAFCTSTPSPAPFLTSSLPAPSHRAALLVSTWAGKSHFLTSEVDLGGSSCTPTALEDIQKARECFRHMSTGSDGFCPRNSLFSQKAPSTLMASTHLLQWLEVGWWRVGSRFCWVDNSQPPQGALMGSIASPWFSELRIQVLTKLLVFSPVAFIGNPGKQE